MKDFEGAGAVVTGGASGIGLALCRALAARGATVVVADIDGAEAPRRAEELGPQHLGVQLDVSDAQAFDSLAQQLSREGREIHLLVNNAGVAGPGGSPIWTATADDWSWVLGVNLLGVVNGLRAFVPLLLAAERSGRAGHVVTTASLSGLLVFPNSGPYTASKHAAVALTEQLGAELELVGSSIGVTVLCPAWVQTGILDSHRLAPEGRDLTPPPSEEQLAPLRGSMRETGLSAEAVAEVALTAVAERRLCVLPEDMADLVRARANKLSG